MTTHPSLEREREIEREYRAMKEPLWDRMTAASADLMMKKQQEPAIQADSPIFDQKPGATFEVQVGTSSLPAFELEKMAINIIANECFINAKNKGFHDNDDEPNRFACYIANLHGEVSELWEAYRAGKLDVACDKAAKMSKGLTCFEEEIADIIIRAFDTGSGHGVNIGEAIRVKMEYNRTRPRMHGKIA